MKLATVICAAMFCLLTFGCQADLSPAGAYGDPYPAPYNDPQISVLSEDLRTVLGFHPATIVHKARQPMQVQVPVRNLAERHYLIDYRGLFYDENGMQLEPVMKWAMASLEPKEVVYLKANSVDANAESYRLEVKWAR